MQFNLFGMFDVCIAYFCYQFSAYSVFDDYYKVWTGRLDDPLKPFDNSSLYGGSGGGGGGNISLNLFGKGNDEPLSSDAGGRTAEQTNVSGAPFASTNGKSGGGGSSSSGAGASIIGSQANVGASHGKGASVDIGKTLSMAMLLMSLTPTGRDILSSINNSGFKYNILITTDREIERVYLNSKPWWDDDRSKSRREPNYFGLFSKGSVQKVRINKDGYMSLTYNPTIRFNENIFNPDYISDFINPMTSQPYDVFDAIWHEFAHFADFTGLYPNYEHWGAQPFKEVYANSAAYAIRRELGIFGLFLNKKLW